MDIFLLSQGVPSHLAKIYVQQLSLLDFDLSGLGANADQDQYIATREYLQCAAQNWAAHFRQASWNDEDRAVSPIFTRVLFLFVAPRLVQVSFRTDNMQAQAAHRRLEFLGIALIPKSTKMNTGRSPLLWKALFRW